MKNRNIIFGAILSVLACVAFLPQMLAQDDNFTTSNTPEGFHALFHQTDNTFNTGVGWLSLFTQTTATANTGCGAGTLALNTGDNNTALGAAALEFNTGGTRNNAVGSFALLFNLGGSFNNAHGSLALENNAGGIENDAFGDQALLSSVTGDGNTAVGDNALLSQDGASFNTGVGKDAGITITTGSDNVCIGHNAGNGIVDGSDIIAIGSAATGIFANFGPTCFIGNIDGEPTSDIGSTVTVLIDSNNNLGTFASSRHVKHDIKPMDKASEVILALKPVSFKYNHDVKGTPCFGLIAEDVDQVDRDLVVRDKNGEPQTVRYEQINAMLLNEFLKEHKKVEEQQASISQLKSDMQTMVAQLKEQAAQIQKVSAQLEVNKPAPQVVATKP
jgi:hypothetical protein